MLCEDGRRGSKYWQKPLWWENVTSALHLGLDYCIIHSAVIYIVIVTLLSHRIHELNLRIVSNAENWSTSFREDSCSYFIQILFILFIYLFIHVVHIGQCRPLLCTYM